jgi:two-component system, LytTR family, sensor histidine kinase AlgZ
LRGTGNHHTALPARDADADVLPNFCGEETLLRVLIFAILFALVVWLLRSPGPESLIESSLILLFVIWVAMSTTGLLCLTQRWLRQWQVGWQVTLPPLVAVLNTALVHLGAEHFGVADPAQRLSIVGVAILMSLIAMHYLYLIAAWKEEMQHVAHAREQALRARVRPHFLFNSMNTIAGLCRSDPAKAEQVTLDLADLFRAAFNTGPMHPLGTEFELIRAYLAIEQTRFEERLQVEWDIRETQDLDLQVPTLVLQPLVENAIQHGIAPSPAGGRVWIRAHHERDITVIVIGNTIAGKAANGTQTAGDEARARLRNAFGERASVTTSRADCEFEIRITLPRWANSSRGEA